MLEFDERFRIIINADMIITGMMNSDPIPMVRAPLRNRMIINPIAAQTNSTTHTHIGGRDCGSRVNSPGLGSVTTASGSVGLLTGVRMNPTLVTV